MAGKKPLRITDIQLTEKNPFSRGICVYLWGDLKDSEMRKLVFGASGVSDHML